MKAGYRMKSFRRADGTIGKVPVKIGAKKKKKKKGAKKSTAKKGGVRSIESRVKHLEQDMRQTVGVLGAVVAKVREHDRKINALAGLAAGMGPRRLGA